jgi:saccharopine dehydrogenase (NADP+, L-glutamate forming)
VQLGATDDTYQLENVKPMTHRQFLNSFLSYNPHDSVELKLAHYLGLEFDGEEMFMLKWLGIFDDELVGLEEGTPAQILEHILKKKWTLKPDDLDMIVMYHKFIYVESEGFQKKEINSHMVVIGENSEDTGMSKTVGLPLAIATKLLLKGKMSSRGVCVPTDPKIYNPVLDELESVGIKFTETESIYEQDS